MLTGYSIIAVPTGIITVEIGRISSKEKKGTVPDATTIQKNLWQNSVADVENAWK